MKKGLQIFGASLVPWLFFLLWTVLVHLCPQLYLQRGHAIAFCFLIVFPLIYFGLCFVSLIFLTHRIWRLQWRKTIRFFATMILFVLFLPYTFGPIWINLVITFANPNPTVLVAVSPEKTWSIKIDEGEKQCYKIIIYKESNPSEMTVFQTKASVLHKMRGTWIREEEYHWNSSDIGTILLIRRNGSWHADPKELLQEVKN